jgi:UDP-N-acetylmuramoyl-tripeptide--D-alanyl-D-alanine ligase
MKMLLSEAARIVGGRLIGKDAFFEGLQVDSREISGGELFCAVRGDHQDGHEFIGNALAGGAVGALVEVGVDLSSRLTNREAKSDECLGPLIVTDSTVDAMSSIASHFRGILRGPVIGVTGSAGKTTVKELIAASMSSNGSVLKSEGNRNTEYGVPMTWANLEPSHWCAVIEMAMRGPGQIAHLARMSAPDIGVITSIGSAHIGELGTADAIAAAKAELLMALPADGTAIVPSETKYIDLLREAATCKVITVGAGGEFEVQAYRQIGDHVEFLICSPQGEIQGVVFGVTKIQAQNAAFAIAAAHAAGIDVESAASSLKDVTFPPGRMDVLTINGVTIWLDAYNSSPESCKLALESFGDAKFPGGRVAILGDMLELGEYAEAKHREIGAIAASANLTKLVLVGVLARFIGDGARQAGFRGEIYLYDDPLAARTQLSAAEAGDAILIKASRGVALERIMEPAP